MSLIMSRSFLGTASRERDCEGFKVALRRATVPPDAVPEHSHETAHLILAVDDHYLSEAVGAADWRGPAMLVYNPPGTMHRDRFAEVGGRFLSIDVPAGIEPRGIYDAVVLKTEAAKASVRKVAAAVLADSPIIELEDALLDIASNIVISNSEPGLSPSWLTIVTEAMVDLANDASLRIHDLAALAGVHPVHLARVFRVQFGCTPGQSLRRLRVERVAADLVANKAIADLAAMHGFADQAHLARCFRDAYGVPPSIFRNAF